MSHTQETYTYRAGKKVILEKEPDQFVVRALPEELRNMGITGAEQVSSSSSRITIHAADLEPMMSRVRHIAPTHHAYNIAESGQEFLITDRVFVTFRDPLAAEDVDVFAGRYGLVLKQRYSDRECLFQLTDHTGGAHSRRGAGMPSTACSVGINRSVPADHPFQDADRP